jgi:tRNA (Thr-GGU) A37 N-methylase
MIAEHPMNLAEQIARLIKSDPIAASQVKEYMAESELVDLLEVTPVVDIQIVKEQIDMDELLQIVVQRFTRAQVLRAFRDA